MQAKNKYTAENYNIYDCLKSIEGLDNTDEFNEILQVLKKEGFVKEKKGKLLWFGKKKNFAMFCYQVSKKLFLLHEKQPYPYFIALIKDKKGNDFNPTILSRYKTGYKYKSEEDVLLYNLILYKTINNIEL
ncbi:MAG: hypothetical protein IJ180_08960 [Bacteroidales bacterium]|nr:hypothetical protein [Bacteroidales bacterium]